MKIRKVIREINASGIIPLLSGGYILLTDPGQFWGMIGAAFLVIGLVYGFQYTSRDTHDSRSQEGEQ